MAAFIQKLTNTPDILPHLESRILQLILWIAVTEQILIPLLTRPLSLQIILPKPYQDFLIANERSKNTISKYISDVTGFITFFIRCKISKEQCLDYKKYLLKTKLCVSTVNSNCVPFILFDLLDRADCFVQLEKFKERIKSYLCYSYPEDYHKLLEESSRPQKKKVNLMDPRLRTNWYPCFQGYGLLPLNPYSNRKSN